MLSGAENCLQDSFPNVRARILDNAGQGIIARLKHRNQTAVWYRYDITQLFRFYGGAEGRGRKQDQKAEKERVRL